MTIRLPRGCAGCLLAASLGLAEAVGAETNATELGSYQVILDREPFGTVTGAGAVSAVAGWAADFTFCGRVSMTNGQELAVIQKKSENRAYYKGVGEMIDDVQIVRIEDGPPVAKLVLQRGHETATVECQPVAGLPAAAGPPRPGIPMPRVANPPPMVRRIPFRRGIQ